jgi:hypothetical protein
MCCPVKVQIFEGSYSQGTWSTLLSSPAVLAASFPFPALHPGPRRAHHPLAPSLGRGDGGRTPRASCGRRGQRLFFFFFFFFFVFGFSEKEAGWPAWRGLLCRLTWKQRVQCTRAHAPPRQREADLAGREEEVVVAAAAAAAVVASAGPPGSGKQTGWPHVHTAVRARRGSPPTSLTLSVFLVPGSAELTGADGGWPCGAAMRASRLNNNNNNRRRGGGGVWSRWLRHSRRTAIMPIFP